ncbi:MAG: LysM peptidoglycan-binding domain-containing protein [Pseudomonadota bacterium]|nr:LysM peptidoglycan-binding domain-containing protein [Pseudomonadota bacterium]
MRQKFSTARRWLAATAVCGFFCVAGAQAADVGLAERAPERYTVQKGDTLWGIAGKFLRDPWRWPDVWRMNREQISNPHHIFPGDVIVLDRAGAPDGAPRLRLERSTVRLSPGIRVSPLESEAVPTIPAGDIEPYLTRALVTGPEGLQTAAEIVAGRDRRVVRGQNDLVYATGIDQAAGDLWYIYRPARTFKSRTNEVLGYEQRFLGVARIERFADVATVRIASASEEIQIGDKLVPAPREQITNYVPHSPPQLVNGQIIATTQDSAEFGRGTVVTIDKGAKDGLDAGSVLAIYHIVPPIPDPRPSKEADRIAQFLEQTKFFQPDRFVRVPDERSGLMFVYRVFDRVSYALILNTTETINIGDWVRQP